MSRVLFGTCIYLNGPKNRCGVPSMAPEARFIYESDRSLAGEAVDSVHDFLVSNGCPERTAMQFDLIVEEVFLNICDYAYREGPGEVRIFCSISDDTVSVRFEDSGPMFDPTAKEHDNPGDDVAGWPIGGLGIKLTLGIADMAEYSYVDGRNSFTVSKKMEDARSRHRNLTD